MIAGIIQISSLLVAIATIYGFKNKIKAWFFDEVNKRLDSLDLQVLRLNILELIHHSPKNKQAIMITYDEYKRKGGNSYIDYVYYEWKKDFLDKDTEPIKYELLNLEKQKGDW